MDYAVQLLTIIGLFLFGGLWMHDHWGLPMWGVVILFFLGFICAVIVIYQRSKEDSKAAEQQEKANKRGEEHQ